MNLSSRQRLLRTIAGQPVDRIPICAPLPWDPLTTDPDPEDWKARPLYRELLPLVQEHCDFLVALSIPEKRPFNQVNAASTYKAAAKPSKTEPYAGIFDRRFFLASPERVTVSIEEQPDGRKLYQYTLRTPQGNLRSAEAVLPGVDSTWEVESLVKTPQDARALLALPDEFDPPGIETFTAGSEKLGERGLPYLFVSSPLVTVSHALGFQRFLEWTLVEPDLVEDLLAAAAERTAVRLEWALDQGVGPVVRFGGSEQATPPMLSKRYFDRYVLKYEAPLWQKVRQAGKILWVHCHGRIRTVIDEFVNAGVQMLDPVEPPPQGDIEIEEARRRAARGPLTLLGNIEMSDLQMSSPAEIEAMVQRAVGEGDRKHFILCASDIAISAIDERFARNVEAYIYAGLKYGTFSTTFNASLLPNANREGITAKHHEGQ